MVAMTSRLVQLCAALAALAACVQNGAYDPSGATTSGQASSGPPGTTGETTSPTTSGTSSTSEASGQGATGSTGDTTTTGALVTTTGATTTGAGTIAVDSSSDGGESTVASSTGPGCADPPEDMCEVDPMLPDYRICERVATWDEARAACEARCMQLVVLDEPESDLLFAVLQARKTAADLAEEQMGGDFLQSVRASWWIGGHKQDGVYVWVDGSPMPPKGTGGWYSNDPDEQGAEACAILAVFGKGNDNGLWFDRSCSQPPHRFVCEPPS